MAQHTAPSWTDGADDPTAIAEASYTSEHLDAHALFADLHLELAPPAMATSFVTSVPPPPRVSVAPVVLYARPDAASAASTVRSRRPPPANVDPSRARLLAVIACGSVALVASLAACFVYSGMPQQTRARAALSAQR